MLNVIRLTSYNIFNAIKTGFFHNAASAKSWSATTAKAIHTLYSNHGVLDVAAYLSMPRWIKNLMKPASGSKTIPVRRAEGVYDLHYTEYTISWTEVAGRVISGIVGLIVLAFMLRQFSPYLNSQIYEITDGLNSFGDSITSTRRAIGVYLENGTWQSFWNDFTVWSLDMVHRLGSLLAS